MGNVVLAHNWTINHHLNATNYLDTLANHVYPLRAAFYLIFFLGKVHAHTHVLTRSLRIPGYFLIRRHQGANDHSYQSNGPYFIVSNGNSVLTMETVISQITRY